MCEKEVDVPEKGRSSIDQNPYEWNHIFYNELGWHEGMPFAARFSQPISGEALEDVLSIWEENEEMTFVEFFEDYDDRACSDWGKSDMCGDTDYTLKELESISWSRLFQSRRLAGAMGLAALPYPPKVVLRAMDHLCQFRCESVEKVNDLCKWIMSHEEEKGNILPLTEPIVPYDDFFTNENPRPMWEYK